MTKPILSRILALSTWTLKKAHKVCCQDIPDCMRYISGVDEPINKKLYPSPAQNHSSVTTFKNCVYDS